MNIEIFKTLAENVRKVKWDKKNGLLNGKTVQIVDVDLNGNAAFDKPLTATVQVEAPEKILTYVGAFWPRNMRSESVEVDGKELPYGRVGLSGKYQFPASIKIQLRFRWGSQDDAQANSLIVTGKTGLSLGMNFLGKEI